MKYYTKKEAIAYLQTRGIAVTHQSLNNLIHKHRQRCKALGTNSDGLPALWTIPQSLLDAYTPAQQQQEAGRQPKTT